MDGHEQVTRAVHREQRPLDLAVERHDFLVRPIGCGRRVGVFLRIVWFSRSDESPSASSRL